MTCSGPDHRTRECSCRRAEARAADAARAEGADALSAGILDEHSRWFREAAAAAGTVLNSGRHTALQKKRHALASRKTARKADYLRFASDLRIPFDNNPAEQVIRMTYSAG
jgi:hypothetical protein